MLGQFFLSRRLSSDRTRGAGAYENLLLSYSFAQQALLRRFPSNDPSRVHSPIPCHQMFGEGHYSSPQFVPCVVKKVDLILQSLRENTRTASSFGLMSNPILPAHAGPRDGRAGRS